jgi:hypothetical protein
MPSHCRGGDCFCREMTATRRGNKRRPERPPSARRVVRTVLTSAAENRADGWGCRLRTCPESPRPCDAPPRRPRRTSAPRKSFVSSSVRVRSRPPKRHERCDDFPVVHLSLLVGTRREWPSSARGSGREAEQLSFCSFSAGRSPLLVGDQPALRVRAVLADRPKVEEDRLERDDQREPYRCARRPIRSSSRTRRCGCRRTPSTRTR